MTSEHARSDDIHAGQPVLTAGSSLEDASAVMILVHGRGATARDILALTQSLNAPGMTFLAPQAGNNTWYPYSFLEPIEKNEPHLTSALNRLGDLVKGVEESNIPAESVILLGFSQGACLASEFAARNARRYGGVCALTGGVIGPPGTPRDYQGSLSGTPVFIGCSDVDAHIPVERVYETEEIMKALGGDVVTQIYPGMAHTVNQDEIEHVQRIVDSVLQKQ